jgi:hypothetical protein
MKSLKDTIKLLENSAFYYTLIIGMDNRYVYVSPQYNRNFDFLNESLVGKPFYITLHPDDIKICQQVGESCFSNPDKLLPATLRKHDGKGGFIFTQWSSKLYLMKTTSPMAFFVLAIILPSHVVTSTKLDNAIAEIEDKNDKLNEIGFMQSHLVRKPLANIMGLANVLTNMEVDHNLAGITNMMVDSANELDNAIKNIVDKTS